LVPFARGAGDDLIRFAREVKAEILLLSAMTEEAIEALEGSAGRLAAAAPTIGFGGQAFNRNPAKAEDLGGHYMGPDAARALEKVLTLLATRRP
ncbi:MAG TPA: hypothetical protein VNT60_02535, partial [Deinococcales bacterium]|nr:hypothetical protein [Deinococcales bacterium]